MFASVFFLIFYCNVCANTFFSFFLLIYSLINSGDNVIRKDRHQAFCGSISTVIPKINNTIDTVHLVRNMQDKVHGSAKMFIPAIYAPTKALYDTHMAKFAIDNPKVKCVFLIFMHIDG